MRSVTLQQARSTLPRLIAALERGTEREIVITRRGRKVARLVLIDGGAATVARKRPRIGAAKGLFAVPDDTDSHGDEVARLFSGG